MRYVDILVSVPHQHIANIQTARCQLNIQKFIEVSFSSSAWSSSKCTSCCYVSVRVQSVILRVDESLACNGSGIKFKHVEEVCKHRYCLIPSTQLNVRPNPYLLIIPLESIVVSLATHLTISVFIPSDIALRKVASAIKSEKGLCKLRSIMIQFVVNHRAAKPSSRGCTVLSQSAYACHSVSDTLSIFVSELDEACQYQPSCNSCCAITKCSL